MSQNQFTDSWQSVYKVAEWFGYNSHSSDSSWQPEGWQEVCIFVLICLGPLSREWFNDVTEQHNELFEIWCVWMVFINEFHCATEFHFAKPPKTFPQQSTTSFQRPKWEYTQERSTLGKFTKLCYNEVYR